MIRVVVAAWWLVGLPAGLVAALVWSVYDRVRRRLHERQVRREYLRIAQARQAAIADGTLILWPSVGARDSGRSARGTAPGATRGAR